MSSFAVSNSLGGVCVSLQFLIRDKSTVNPDLLDSWQMGSLFH